MCHLRHVVQHIFVHQHITKHITRAMMDNLYQVHVTKIQADKYFVKSENNLDSDSSRTNPVQAMCLKETIMLFCFNL